MSKIKIGVDGLIVFYMKNICSAQHSRMIRIIHFSELCCSMNLSYLLNGDIINNCTTIAAVVNYQIFSVQYYTTVNT